MYLPPVKTKWPLIIGAGLSIIIVALWYSLVYVLSPFIIGLICAYLFNRAALHFAARMPRALASFLIVVVVIAVIVLFLAVIVPLLIYQIRDLTDKLPLIVNWLKQTADNTAWQQWLHNHLSVNELLRWDNLEKLWAENSDAVKSVLAQAGNYVRQTGNGIVLIIFNILIIPLAFYYFLNTWPTLIAGAKKLIPRRYVAGVSGFARDLDAALSGYLRGQLLVMIVMGLIYGSGLLLIGLNNGFAIGFMTGFLVFVPYLGFAVGSVIATLAAILQFGDIGHIGAVWVVFLIGQSLESYLITPKLIGNRIGLSPIIVIFALLAFSVLLGFTGMFLALPLSAILVVSINALLTRYYRSDYYLDR